MISGILVNMSFLVSCLYIGALIFQKIKASRRILKQHPRFCSCLFGVFCGFSGIVLMVFAARAGAGPAIDFHCLVILLTAVYGGTLPLLLCASLQALYRILSLGLGAEAVRSMGSVILMSAAAGLIGRTKMQTGKKWALCTALFIPTASLDFFALLPSAAFWSALAVFSAVLLPVSAFTYYAVRTELTKNELMHRLQQESARDYLTGLNNVRRFDKMYHRAIHGSLNRHRSLSLLMCDIDFFKKVNDRYGHRNGDTILVQFSRILQRNFPRSVISRNGGEEFTVLLHNCAESQALAAAERLRADVEHTGFALLDGSKIHVTISVGVASCLCSANDADRLLERADTALYMAKRGGRNKVSAAHYGVHPHGTQAEAPD